MTTPTINAAIAAAMAQVYANANPSWKDIAYRAVVYVSRTHRAFTSDDVWEALTTHYPHVTTHEHRAMGPVLRNAVRDGICEINSCTTCGTRKVVVQSRRPQANGMDTPVYRSLIFGTLAPQQ